MARKSNMHPGQILLEEFLLPMDITVYSLSQTTEIPHEKIAKIIQGSGRITHKTASRLGDFFGTSDRFWLGLQAEYDNSDKNIN